MSDIVENNRKRILILGEYSTFSRNLKQGFKHFGCKVTVVTSGDGFKRIRHDKEDLNTRVSDLSVFGLRLRGTWWIKGLKNFLEAGRYKIINRGALDLVLIINPDFLSSKNSLKGYFTLDDCKRLLKKDGKLFMSACGNDIAYLKYGSRMRYWPFSDYEAKEIERMSEKLHASLFNSLLSSVDGVIPVMFDYSFAYRELSKEMPVRLLTTIPLPVNVKAIRYVHNTVDGKIIIFSGKSRDDFKGSEIIIQALQNIKERYPDKVELLLPEKLPLEEYLEVMSHANIVVDQCRSYSYAMNALYALSMGKVVLSGNEPECSAEFGCDVPVINILPDVSDIERKLERFIHDPSLIQSHGISGRKFVEQYHDSHIVASRYLSLLTET